MPHQCFAGNVDDKINEANQIIDSINYGEDVSQSDLRKLQSYINTVNNIPSENLNEATINLMNKYQDSVEVRRQLLDLEIKDLEKNISDTDSAIRDPETNSRAKAELNTQNIENRTKLAGLKYEKDYIEYKPGCRPWEKNKCHPYCKYRSTENCTLCPIFTVVFNTVSAVTDKSVRTFSPAISVLVVVGFAVWLAIQVLSFVSSVETKDIKDLLQSIITQGFVVLIAFMILRSGVGSFFDTFIEPFYVSGHNLAQAALTNCPKTTSNEDGNTNTGTAAQKTKDVCTEYAEIKNANSGIIKKAEGLPPSMGESIVKTMTLMENRLREIKALGSAMICKSWQEAIFIFPKWIYLFTGILVWIFAIFLIIGIPFLMIDAVLQLGVAGALLPVAVGGFAFKSTRQYTKKVWETFLNSMFTFLFITIVVLVLLGVLEASITESVKNIDQTGEMFGKMFSSNWQSTELYYEDILQSFQWASPHFLKLLFIFLLAWSVMKMAKEFADEFASSISSTEIGSSIGTMAASTAKGMAVKTAKPLAKAAGSHIRQAVGSRILAGNRAFRRAKYKSELKNFDSVASNNGVKEYTDKKGRIHRLENGVVTIIKNKNGKEVKQIISENFTITQTKKVEMVNGKPVEVYREKIKLNNRQLDRIINDRGEFDKKELDKIYQGLSAEQKKEIQKTVTRALIEKWMSKSVHNFDQANTKAAEIVSVDDRTGEVVLRQVTAKGEVIFSRMKANSSGVLETEITKIDSKGNVMRLSSDGIHNKMEKFSLQEGVDAKTINNLNDVQNNRKKDSQGRYDGKVSYGYTQYYRDAVGRGADPRKIPLGAMSEEEATECYKYHRNAGNEFGKADMNIYFK